MTHQCKAAQDCLLIEDPYYCTDKCPQGYGPQENIQPTRCEKCLDTCLECSGGACNICKEGYFKENGGCVSCKIGEFYQNGKCVKCAPPCLECNTLTGACTKCHPLSHNSGGFCTCVEGTTLNREKGICEENCGERGYFLKDKGCVDCPSECTTCQKEQPSCSIQRYFYLQKEKEALDAITGQNELHDIIHRVLLFNNDQKRVTYKSLKEKFNENSFNLNSDAIELETEDNALKLTSKIIEIQEKTDEQALFLFTNITTNTENQSTQNKKSIKISVKNDLISTQLKRISLKLLPESEPTIELKIEQNQLKDKEIKARKESNEKVGENVKDTVNTIATASEGSYFILSFLLSSSPTFLMSFAQSAMVIARMRNINIEFGVILEGFLGLVSTTFNDNDPSYEQSQKASEKLKNKEIISQNRILKTRTISKDSSSQKILPMES